MFLRQLRLENEALSYNNVSLLRDLVTPVALSGKCKCKSILGIEKQTIVS